MAIKKIRKKRLNSSGEYDTIYYETEADLVIMADGDTVENKIAELQREVEDGLSNVGTNFTTDETLILSADGVLSVNTASAVEADNTLPITSAAVQASVGNIEVLLETI